MVRWRSILCVLGICSLCAVVTAAAAPDVSHEPNELLVILADDTPVVLEGPGAEGRVIVNDPELAAVLSRHGLYRYEMLVRKDGPLSENDRRYLKLLSDRADFDPLAAAAALTGTRLFLAASPNYRLRLFVMPNDTYVSRQWAVFSTNDADIDLVEAWDVTQGGPGTVIAIIDTGVDWSHPDLAGNAWHNPGETPGNGLDDDGNGYIDDVYGWDCGSDDNDPRPEPYFEQGIDVGFHGTHCAGIAAAVTNNATGIASAGWGCSVMGLKVTSSGDSFTTQAVTTAFLYAIEEQADVISMSFGGTFQDFGYMQSLVDDATAAGIVCVAAAGNNNTSALVYPAALDNVLSVGATNVSNQRASFSTYGSWVDLAAPGEHIWSCVQTNYQWDLVTQLLFALLFEWDGVNPYMYSDGTSMACPLVAGVCGLVRSAMPSLSAEQVAQRLIDTGDVVVFDQPMGVKVNAFAAVEGISVAVPVATPSPPAGLVGVPNPFNPRTALRVHLANDAPVRLTIHDVSGRLVRTLLDEPVSGGTRIVEWDGRDRSGRVVPSGTYFVRLVTDGTTHKLKLVRLE